MMNHNLRAAALLTLGMLLFAGEDALIKTLTRELPFSQVLGMIGLAGVLVFGGLLRLGGGRFWTRDLLAPAVVLRNSGEAVSAVAIVLALGLADLSVTAAITQAVPLFITFGAALLLGERVGWRRATAIGLGFVGVLLIVKPGLAGFEPASLWAVVAAAGLAARDLATRRVPARMSSPHLSASAFAAILLGAVLMGLVLGETPVPPTAAQTLLALGCVTLTITGYTLLVAATRIGEASALAPVRYARLVFALILARIVFGERLDPLTLAGAAIIVGSGCYTLWREARLSRRASALVPAGTAPVQPASGASGSRAA
ncbi:DMT family transporter [Amaricoccus solimangrovi]|uniref:DMT family transporter n=1 Tax=Amaricoccus solimangrovi TaxID=2589815 RepID=A0A501WUB6_9RHOB|nr:DMT family transporter [Amaricoccus solimangrovi]TPE50967.1 DMT family transporter [Amaricoccus solimangrovi]